ncbi:MAG: hypothetical protein IT279_02750 [Ignavibacteriaceae bacterium]|nr:hypothetical protein [Ignavibacteriaceae bacterium]
MKLNPSNYNSIAAIFEYPQEDYKEKIETVLMLLQNDYPDLVEAFQLFSDFVSRSSRTEIEEIYTRTFDVQAITTLDIGYVLFGDDYKRGELLANLSREQLAAKNECGTELADFLPNVLRLLPKMEDDVLRLELVQKIILTSLTKIVSEFDEKKIDKKNQVYMKHHKTMIADSEEFKTIYVKPLMVTKKLIQKDFKIEWVDEDITLVNFTNQLANEIKLF